MLNFLPQKNKNQIVTEYLLRVIALLLISLFISSLILISLFAPSFFFVSYKNNTVKNQLESIKQENVDKGVDPMLFIKNVNKLVVSLSPSSTGVGYTEIINKIVNIKNNDIKISSIDIVDDKGTNSKKILLNGIASTRDSLTSYEKEIKIDGFFDSIIFPVSNFIKSTDSEFSATLIYKNK